MTAHARRRILLAFGIGILATVLMHFLAQAARSPQIARTLAIVAITAASFAIAHAVFPDRGDS